MDPEYARRYRALYERHWWWRARERLLVETLRRRRPPRGWGWILDVGCGDGLLFDCLAEFGEVEGVEVDPSVVSPAGRHRARIHVGPFDASFRPGKRYSLVLMLDVVEHLPDPVGALRLALELLEPDGVLVATVPAFPLLWTTHDDVNHHVARFTKRSFRALADRAGLAIATARYFFHWVFLAKLAVRLVEAVHRPRPAPPQVPPRWINALLYALSGAERRLLTSLGVPFGSSLLIVGQKARG